MRFTAREVLACGGSATRDHLQQLPPTTNTNTAPTPHHEPHHCTEQTQSAAPKLQTRSSGGVYVYAVNAPEPITD